MGGADSDIENLLNVRSERMLLLSAPAEPTIPSKKPMYTARIDNIEFLGEKTTQQKNSDRCSTHGKIYNPKYIHAEHLSVQNDMYSTSSSNTDKLPP